MKTNYLLTTLLILFFQLSIAQVGIGTTSPDSSSELDVSSPLNDKGVLIPRMTQAQRNLIASPATSLLIYQIDNTPGFYYYNGTIWVGINAGASTDWTLLGNSGTTSATNFFGTTDDNDIVFKRFNVRAGFIGNPIAAPLTTLNRRNTSFGANSLLNPAGGYRNTAIGSNVMAGNTSGNRNVAVGDAAMSSNTSGQQNVAIGVGALFTNQLGNSNVAIGRNALTLTNGTTGTQASNNTAVGMISMELNTTGAYNSAFGRESLYNNSTGDYNVGIGWKAGFANVVGINNVSIGNSSGLASTGSNNITIGSFSEVPVLTNSDQLSIGNVIYGTTMTSTAAGKIGVGEANPNAKLQITSSSQASPAITDGVIIPKVDNLAAAPTAAQEGMLVYLNAISGTNQPGFYYWDNDIPGWVGLNSTVNGDHDWYKVGTTTAPTLITDDMFHTGNVAIGKNTADYPLDILTTNNVNGIYNELSNNTNAGSKVGIINNVSDTSTDDKIGLRNAVTSNGNSLYTVGISNLVGSVGAQLYGTSNTLSGSNGTQSNLDGTRNTISVLTGANNNVNGVYNILTPSTTGLFNGVRNLVTSSNGGFVNGVLNEFSGSTTFENNGIYSSINVNGGADVNGINNLITGTGNVFGLKNSITGSGASINKGQYSNLSGTTTGDQYGSHNIISSQGNISSSNHYGINNFLSGNALNKYGTYSTLSGAGNLYGNYVNINNATGFLYGGYTTIAGSFGTDRYGQKTILNNGGAVGETWGNSLEITSSSSSPSYGSEIILNGTGTGTKYGNKLLINPAALGTHYGIYSEALGGANFAGYFLGNVGIGTTVANTYTLPASRATSAGQIMQSGGADVVTWQTPAAALNSSAWLTTGNSGMTAATNFIGTTDSNPLVFRTTGTERMRIIQNSGEVVVGATVPFAGDKFSSYAIGNTQFAVNGYSTLGGVGIFGDNTGAGIGVYGNNSATGVGVEGDSVGTGIGVFGFNSGAGVGVFGNNTSTGIGIEGDSVGTGIGVFGFNNGTGRGVQGTNTSTGPAIIGFNTGNGVGVQGQSVGNNSGVFGFNNSTGRGVFGNNTGGGNGVQGQSVTTGVGVIGFNTGAGVGVQGQSSSTGTAIFGIKTTTTGNAIVGQTPAGSTGFAVFANGNMGASGTKPFYIDHPTDPENKYLRHFALESNEVLNVYRGNVILDSNGEAIVTLPNYFDEVNINFSYNLTSIGSKSEVFIKEEIKNNQFKIAGGNANQKISWQVYAERNDLYLQKYPENRKVEVDKNSNDKGKYLMPDLFNQSKEKGIFNEIESSKESSNSALVPIEIEEVNVKKQELNRSQSNLIYTSKKKATN